MTNIFSISAVYKSCKAEQKIALEGVSRLLTGSVHCAVQVYTTTEEQYLSGLKVWEAKR